jgi:hypothetical protein
MDWLRILVVVFLVAHGLGHLIWFLAAWTPIRSGVKDGPWILPGGVTIRDPAGRLLGLVALLATLAFLVAAWALIGREAWWASATIVGCLASAVAVVPWLRQSPGTTPFNAIAADIALLILLALPVAGELTGTA